MIKRFRDLGWEGPFTGHGKHPEYMTKGTQVCKIPNPHGSNDIGLPLLKRILSQAGISEGEWTG